MGMRAWLAVVVTMSLMAATVGSAEVDGIIDRASRQAAAFGPELAGYVAREDYLQTVRRWTGAAPAAPAMGPAVAARHLQAELLLVHDPATPWQLHRDVVAVDGVAVPDRADRLVRLFADPHADARRRLREITDESARFNLGHVIRNINVPTFPLLVLHPAHRDRFRIRDSGHVREDGATARLLTFSERGRPRVVRGQHGRDVRLEGSLTVDVSTGELLRATIVPRSDGLTSRLEVWYGRVEGVPRRVPLRLWEWYRVAREEPDTYVEGTATYADVRRYTTIVSPPRVP